MEKIKTFVDRVFVDFFYDCIFVKINSVETQIVFAKEDNVSRFNGKQVYLEKPDEGDYRIEEVPQVELKRR